MGLIQYRLEHRRQVPRRGVDDLQNLGGCGLLFNASRCSSADAILDGDDRLIGKGADKVYLSVGKQLEPLAREQ